MAALKYKDSNGDYQPIVGLNVQCEPDNEDLHYNSNNQLQFKDRPNTSGMGRVILRKNMVSGVNTLTQSMMPTATGGNTIYVIQYDFTLGENITIPANCVLEFDGGSIDGAHTLTGTNTGIDAGLVKIFNTDVTIAGTWKVVEAYPEWFGAKGDGIADDTNAVQSCLLFTYLCYSLNVLFTKTYLITNTIYIPYGAFIKGVSLGRFTVVSKPTFIVNLTNADAIAFDMDIYSDQECTIRFSSEYTSFSNVSFYKKTDSYSLSIEDITIRSDNDSLMGLRVAHCVGCKLNNISIAGTRIGIQISNAWNSNISSICCNTSHLGAYLGSNINIQNFTDFQVFGNGKVVEFTTIENSYFAELLSIVPNYLDFYEEYKSVGVICMRSSFVFNGLISERYDYALIFYRADANIDGLYLEYIQERLISSHRGHLLINNIQGTITATINVGYYLTGTIASLEIKNAADSHELPVELVTTVMPYSSAINRVGSSSERPVNVVVGDRYFDTTLGKPIWAKTVPANLNITWVDATGASV